MALDTSTNTNQNTTGINYDLATNTINDGTTSYAPNSDAYGSTTTPTNNIPQNIASSPIAVDSLGQIPPPAPTLPSPTPTPDYAGATSGAASSVTTTPTTDTTTPTPTPYTDQSSSLLDSIKSLMGIDTGKAAYTQAQLDQSGATALQAKQNDLGGKIQALNDQSPLIPDQVNAANAGTGATTGGVAPLIASQQRASALQALKYKMEYDVNAGNLATAQTTAQNAVNLKYADTENQIADQEKMLSLYTPFMNAEQQAKATQLQEQYDTQKTAIATQEDNEVAVQGIIATAINDANNGGTAIPANIMAQAQKITDPTQANILLAPYLKDTQAIQKAIDAHNLNQSTIAKNTSDMNNTWSTPYTDPTTGKVQQVNNKTGEVRNVATATNTIPTTTNPTPVLPKVTNYTPAQTNTLIGTGLSSSDVSQMKTYVNTYGVQALFTANPSLTSKQKAEINKIYSTNY